MPDSFDVFISYKREDQTFAETLRERLLAWGYTAWMDKYNIPAGAYWPDEIDRGLNASQVVIGVLSPRAVASRNVKNEWDWSIVNGKRLLMMMIEPCVVPMNYVSINYIDCAKDQAAGLARLQTVLTSPTPPPPPVDPYRDYLQALYDRINTYLAQTIIKVRPDDPRTPEPIQLRSERTRGVVDTLFEKRDEIDPLFMIGGIRQEPVKLDGDFRAAFDYFDGRVLLLGEPGAGKTITLLHFGRDAVVQRIQNPAKPLPVLAIIPTWDAEKQMPLTEWLANSYGAPPDVARIMVEGRTLLLLDGLDELGNEREDSETHERYDPRPRFMGIIPANNQIVVTCRVKDYKDIGERIALKGAVILQQLTDAQIHDYLSEEVPDLWTALEMDKELRNVARTPLLLSLFAFGYKDQGEEAGKLRDLRKSPGELRDAIFRQYVTRRYEHEERKLRSCQPPKRLFSTLDGIYAVLGRAAIENMVKWQAEENVLVPQYFDLPDKFLPVFIELAAQLHLLMLDEKNSFRFIHLLLYKHFGFRFALPRLRDANKHTRRRAADALGVIGDTRAVEPLITALSDTDAGIRSSIANALGKIGDAQAIEVLTTALYDADRQVRYHAVVALGRIGKPAVESLIAALYNADTEVRSYAAESLGKIEDSRAVKPLIATLRDANEGVRANALNALGQIGDPRAVDPLITALRDENEQIRDGAADALGIIKDIRAIGPLIAVLGNVDILAGLHAANALSQIGNPTVEPLIAVLCEADANVRALAAFALGKIGHISAVKPLIVLLSDTTKVWWGEKTCNIAAKALEQIGTPEALAAVEAWRREQNNE